MDFTNNVFQKPAATLSDDTMSHANLVQACRFGWSAAPPGTGASVPLAPPAPMQAPPTALSNNLRSKRLTPCRGRLYHQLTCSHRIRTDLVEDCGTNCLEPFDSSSDTPFYCQECVAQEADSIWQAREAELNATYLPMEQMSTEEYEAWYNERRQLEARFAQDRRIYDAQLKANSRPSNICSVIESSQEEKAFAAELDSLSLSLMAPADSATTHYQPQHRHRVNLPNDVSEQLHWSLKSLAIDRGSCGVEYSASQPAQTMRAVTEEDLWHTRDRN